MVRPLSLYPVKFEEILRDVLTIKPPPKRARGQAKEALQGPLKLRHGAMLALAGWYLMLPPTSPGNKYPHVLIDESAPLNKWQMIQALDKAIDCENLREALVKRTEPTKGMTVEKEREIERMFQYSKCVSTDDPRLKSN